MDSLDVLLPGHSDTARRCFAALSLILGSLVTLALAVFGAWLLLSSKYGQGTNKQQSMGYTTGDVLGFVASLYLLPLSASLLSLGSLRGQKRPDAAWPRNKVWLLPLALASLAAAAGGICLSKSLLDCGILFCQVEDRTDSGLSQTGLRVSVGIWLLLLALALALGLAASLRSARAQRPSCELPPLAARLRRRQRWRILAGSFLAIVVVPLSFLLTTLLPPRFDELQLHGARSVPKWMAKHVHGSEVPHAVMRTVNLELSSKVVLKLFPDTLMYFSFLELVALLSVLAAAWPACGRLLASRGLGRLSLGECGLLGLLLCLLMLWVTYWLHDHRYAGGKWHSLPEKLARTCGTTAVLCTSLSLLVATKNSLWLQALGASWESGLWLHRWAGRAALLLILVHVASFWVDFAVLDVFPHDIMALPTFYPMNGRKPAEPKGDDWTISVMQLVGYPSLLAMGLPQLWRRAHWELFRFSHMAFMVLLPAVLLHATGGWYYLLSSAAFWLLDAALRFASSTQPTTLLSVAAHKAEGGVTELRFQKSFHEPGQYCFINIPEISLWEWHPFSLCSSPLDGTAQMCIKSMGPGTFTGRLLDLASRRAGSDALRFVVNVDGPYGPALDPRDYTGILLLAGGIGITPMHSTFRTLAQLAQRNEVPRSLRLVRLVWVARSEALFQILLESLLECIRPGSFEVVLYVDDPESGPPASGLRYTPTPGLLVFTGRPLFEALYTQLWVELEGRGQVLVKACGPPPMDRAAELAAMGRKTFDYESELFVL